MKPLWMCMDEDFWTEFGLTVEQCIDKYRESRDKDVDVSSLTFYMLNQPYEVETFYVIKEKK
jgi:hypothetical protein